MGEQYLTEKQVIDWQSQKRAAWMRDRELIAQGKLRPEDLSATRGLGSLGEINFDAVNAALQRDDEDRCWAED